MRIVLTGGTGFIGRVLMKELVSAGHRVVLLARGNVTDLPEGVESVKCAVEEGPPDRTTLAAVDAVIHLAGESISRRWTTAWKRRIVDSRIRTTQHLVQAMAQLDSRPEVFVCASAVGFYGDRGPAYLDEGSEGGHGFLSDVCRAWEDEARKAEELGIRTVRARIGVVLGEGGGALAKMLLPFRLGLGGPLGSGRQYLSWIHREDVAGLLRHAVESDDVQGAMNLVAPHPVKQKDFARTLAHALKRPAFLKAPSFALRVLLGEMAELVLGGQRVLPRVAEGTGYTFRHPDLKGALRLVLARDDEARARAEAEKQEQREQREAEQRARREERERRKALEKQRKEEEAARAAEAPEGQGEPEGSSVEVEESIVEPPDGEIRPVARVERPEERPEPEPRTQPEDETAPEERGPRSNDP